LFLTPEDPCEPASTGRKRCPHSHWPKLMQARNLDGQGSRWPTNLSVDGTGCLAQQLETKQRDGQLAQTLPPPPFIRYRTAIVVTSHALCFVGAVSAFLLPTTSGGSPGWERSPPSVMTSTCRYCHCLAAQAPGFFTDQQFTFVALLVCARVRSLVLADRFFLFLSGYLHWSTAVHQESALIDRWPAVSPAIRCFALDWRHVAFVCAARILCGFTMRSFIRERRAVRGADLRRRQRRRDSLAEFLHRSVSMSAWGLWTTMRRSCTAHS